MIDFISSIFDVLVYTLGAVECSLDMGVTTWGSGLHTVRLRPFALSLSKGSLWLRQAQPERNGIKRTVLGQVFHYHIQLMAH
jgi:hypothetical protein